MPICTCRVLIVSEVSVCVQGCGDSCMYSLAKLQHLEVLVLSGCPISSSGLDILAAGCPQDTLRVRPGARSPKRRKAALVLLRCSGGVI